mgnify:CR=1 FL=1
MALLILMVLTSPWGLKLSHTCKHDVDDRKAVYVKEEMEMDVRDRWVSMCMADCLLCEATGRGHSLCEGKT